MVCPSMVTDTSRSIVQTELLQSAGSIGPLLAKRTEHVLATPQELQTHLALFS